MTLRGIAAVLLAFTLGTTVAGSTTIQPSSATTKPSRMLYFVGDSITAGAGIPVPAQHRDRYTSRARNLLCGYRCTQTRTVGHGGQCLAFPGCGYGPSLLDTFRAEVINAKPRPTEVVVEIGVNDLAHLTDEQFHGAYRQLIAWGKAAGIPVHIGTIPPSNPTWPYHYGIQDQRLRVNQWIRETWPTQHVDFASRTEGTNHMLKTQYDSGDGLHPNAYGASRMADAVMGRGL